MHGGILPESAVHSCALCSVKNLRFIVPPASTVGSEPGRGENAAKFHDV